MKVLTGFDRREAGLTGLVSGEPNALPGGHGARITRSEQRKARNKKTFGG
ncbi:Uncharacterised protein [Amycolatopsis camponoti]|uniref:Uncharacterized protein n=1 Tax=Amycolatopsis camponoti TaxID=2606593 RepID=A0A6I8M513_9PSEU|nr:Uncharacterised protein [Amycolatopsis camponoti]